MREVTFTDPHRRRHFEFFQQMNHPHFSICANVSIGDFRSHAARKGLLLTPLLVYWIARTANDIRNFRWRIRDGRVVEHDQVHPSFTVTTEVSEVFSFCTVTYSRSLSTFVRRAQTLMEEMRINPSFSDEPGRDDYLFLSAIPWVSFTGLTHAMHYHPHDSVPRITWGKFFMQDGNWVMPVSVQAHHALVDGQHVGTFFQHLEQNTQAYLKT